MAGVSCCNLLNQLMSCHPAQSLVSGSNKPLTKTFHSEPPKAVMNIENGRSIAHRTRHRRTTLGRVEVNQRFTESPSGNKCC